METQVPAEKNVYKNNKSLMWVYYVALLVPVILAAITLIKKLILRHEYFIAMGVYMEVGYVDFYIINAVAGMFLISFLFIITGLVVNKIFKNRHFKIWPMLVVMAAAIVVWLAVKLIFSTCC